jgi:hypothetical protein
MQSTRRDLIENEAVILSAAKLAGLRNGPQKRSGIGKEYAQKTPIALKILGLIQNGAPNAQI